MKTRPISLRLVSLVGRIFAISYLAADRDQDGNRSNDDLGDAGTNRYDGEFAPGSSEPINGGNLLYCALHLYAGKNLSMLTHPWHKGARFVFGHRSFVADTSGGSVNTVVSDLHGRRV